MPSIRIENAEVGGAQYTTMASATRYVELGRARWTKRGTLKFMEDHHANESACGSLREATLGDGTAATEKELRAIPVMRPRILMTIPTQRETNQRLRQRQEERNNA